MLNAMQDLWVTWDSGTWKSWNEYFDVFCIVLSFLSCLLSFGFVICHFLSSGCVMFPYLIKFVCNSFFSVIFACRKCQAPKKRKIEKMTEKWRNNYQKLEQKSVFFDIFRLCRKCRAAKKTRHEWQKTTKNDNPKWQKMVHDRKRQKTDKRQWQKNKFFSDTAPAGK